MAANTGYFQIRYESYDVGVDSPVILGYKESATDTHIPLES